MANSSTGMTGTARFLDCGCGNCQGGRTTHDAGGFHAPATVDPAELARQNDPRRHDNAVFSVLQKLPIGASYYVTEIDGVPHLMHRRDAKAEGGTGTKTGDAARAAWTAATATLIARNRANAEHYAKLAADPSRAVMGR